MKKYKFSKALYAFLEQGNYLESPERIALGKKLYRKQYLRERKAYYRSTKREITLALTKEEEALLQRAAEEQAVKLPEYIRSAAKAYAAQVFLTPSHPTVVSLQQNLIITRTQISRVAKSSPGMFTKSREAKIEELLLSLEAMMKKAFQNPQNIQSFIKESIAQRPEIIESLKQIIAEHAH